MTKSFGDIIRELVDCAQKDCADPVEYVQQYMDEKDSRITRAEAQRLIDIHDVGSRNERLSMLNEIARKSGVYNDEYWKETEKLDGYW